MRCITKNSKTLGCVLWRTLKCDYLKAVDTTDGKVVNNTECIIYLHEIDVIHKHQIMLDSAMIGNVELMKYAESKGEDIFYYKVFIYIFSNINNPAQAYMLQRMLQNGSTDKEKITEMHDKKLITDDTYNLVMGYLIQHKSSRWFYVPIFVCSCAIAYYACMHLYI